MKEKPTHQPVLLWTLWRSGTHWLADMVAELLGRPWRYLEVEPFKAAVADPEFYRKHLMVSHICLEPEDLLTRTEPLGVKILLLFRDLRDVLASNVNMRKHREGYRTGLPPFPDMSLEEILDWETTAYGRFYNRDLPRWVEFDHPRLWRVRYEDLVGDCAASLAGIARFLERPVSRKCLQSIADAHRFANRSRRKPGHERKTDHNRKGVVGDHRNQFNAETREFLNNRFEKALKRMGYAL